MRAALKTLREICGSSFWGIGIHVIWCLSYYFRVTTLNLGAKKGMVAFLYLLVKV